VVFDELSHVERHPTWANPKASMTMQQTSGEDPGPDARYRSTGVFTGKEVSADISVTKFDPSREFSIRSDQHQDGKHDAWYENDYTLRAEGGGTVVTKHVTGSLSPVVFALAHFAIKKDAMTSLGNLKRMMESKATAGGTV
jgi:hypothetical protein